MCSARPSSTVATNQASACKRSSPKRAVLLNNRHATAMGANRITISMILAVIAYRDSSTLTSGVLTWDGINVMANPTNSAKNIRCSMFGGSDATASTGFEGTMVFTTCISGLSVLVAVFCAVSTVFEASAPKRCCNAEAVEGSTFLPGFIVFASVNPITTEMADNTRQ